MAGPRKRAVDVIGDLTRVRVVFHDEDRVAFGRVGLFIGSKKVAEIDMDDIFDADGNRFDWSE